MVGGCWRRRKEGKKAEALPEVGRVDEMVSGWKCLRKSSLVERGLFGSSGIKAGIGVVIGCLTVVVGGVVFRGVEVEVKVAVLARGEVVFEGTREGSELVLKGTCLGSDAGSSFGR
jgi:hypothetical protein